MLGDREEVDITCITCYTSRVLIKSQEACLVTGKRLTSHASLATLHVTNSNHGNDDIHTSNLIVGIKKIVKLFLKYTSKAEDKRQDGESMVA